MTVCLDSYFDTNDVAYHLPRVNRLLATASVEITFWGTRVITSSKYPGQAALDIVLQRIFHAAYTRADKSDFTVSERIAGLEILKKIRRLYEISDTKLLACHVITRIFSAIREWFWDMSSSRCQLDFGFASSYFRSYSEEEFQKSFGYAPSISSEDPNIEGWMSGVSCVLVKESVLRARAR